MNRQKIILAVSTLALMGATAAVLLHLRAHQRLGEPGVKTRPLAGSKNLEILMPETVPGFSSEILTNSEMDTLSKLPADTSMRARLYRADDNFISQTTTVLMGSDRSSIHAPQICMTGMGWTIDDAKTHPDTIRMERPFAYDLPVNKLVATKQFKNPDGKVQTIRGIYLYWFVDANHYTANEWRRKMWLVPRDLLLTGVLDRWAYISYFSPCLPGQEAATYDRMKKLIALAVPEFQLVPHAGR
jgi:hypothetical protein